MNEIQNDIQLIEVRALPPERDPKRSMTLACGGCCCCCCCCCLHSVGTITGGILGSVNLPNGTPAFAAKSVAVGVYWVVTLIVAAVGAAVMMDGHSSDIEAPIIAFAMFAPLLQGIAWFISLVVVAVLPGSIVPEKGAALTALAKILGFSILGGIIGTIVMIVPLVLLGILR